MDDDAEYVRREDTRKAKSRTAAEPSSGASLTRPHSKAVSSLVLPLLLTLPPAAIDDGDNDDDDDAMRRHFLEVRWRSRTRSPSRTARPASMADDDEEEEEKQQPWRAQR